MDFVVNVSFIIPYRGIAFVSETPKKINWHNGMLHNENQAAVEYKDGYGLYMYHGVRVPEKVILQPEKLTKEDWLNEKNLEVRRIIQERMGERFVTEIKGKVVSKHQDKRIGEIIEIDISPDPEKIVHYLHAQDWSTERMYFLRIPPDITDSMEAQAFTYSNERVKLTKEDFEQIYQRKVVRT